MSNYYVLNDIVIIKYDFNNIINIKTQAFQYKKLIFADYNDVNVCVETNNKYCDKYHVNYVCSKFNQPIANGFDNLFQLTHLTFGHKFNHPLSNSLDKLSQLKQLTFGACLNHPLSNSFDNLSQLKQLTFGACFNHPLSNSFDNLSQLKQLTFGWNFNQPLSNSFDNLT
jgi:hypothetical protein